MSNSLLDTIPKGICLLLASLICLALLSVHREARGQLIITRGAVSNVLVASKIEPPQHSHRQNVSLSMQDRLEMADTERLKPSVELEISFDPDSAIISPRARASLDALGRALSGPDLRGGTFVIGGHTDGLEGEAYSQRLAERRAEAIKRELVKSFNVPGSDLVTVGYGSSNLKISVNPFAAQNNRVQIVNMELKKQER